MSYITARWRLDAKNGIVYWQKRKAFINEIDETARAARGNNEDMWSGLRHDHDDLLGTSDKIATMSMLRWMDNTYDRTGNYPTEAPICKALAIIRQLAPNKDE